MIVVPLDNGESYRLAELGVTADADPWVVEVETFLFTSVPTQRGVAAGSHTILITADNGVAIVAAAHKPHPSSEAELLQALVVAVDQRGQGHAEPALRATLEYLRALARVERVMWLVHRANEAMLQVSRRVVAPAGVDGDFVVFVEP